MYIFVIGFGLVFLMLGVASLRRSREHFANGQQTEAVVVEIKDVTWYNASSGSGKLDGYQAVYAFTDQAGNEHRIPGGTKSTSKNRFSLGERKTVVYNPDSPSEVLDESPKVYAGLALYFVLGLTTVALGVAGFVYDW